MYSVSSSDIEFFNISTIIWQDYNLLTYPVQSNYEVITVYHKIWTIFYILYLLYDHAYVGGEMIQ